MHPLPVLCCCPHPCCAPQQPWPHTTLISISCCSAPWSPPSPSLLASLSSVPLTPPAALPHVCCHLPLPFD